MDNKGLVGSGAGATKPKPLDQVRQVLHARHYSPQTEDVYVIWIKRFIFFHNKHHPAEMGEPEINAFLSVSPEGTSQRLSGT
ncbi:MAG TPA: phage integrase N-terminal SAM-like domain-containing protein [Candidatus Limnocylindrales bacterium]|nr:phage integrase N-terminal SAM-like domain-containing protein [Candidatus Limnocylindrales bacterium]